MEGRTFAFGDIHGEIFHLEHVLARLPSLHANDTLVFLGDYVDRGPRSKEVLARLMALPGETPAKTVFLRGNHEDAWLRVCGEGWDEFVMPPAHGCLATVRSFTDFPLTVTERPRQATDAETGHLASGDFFPPEIVAWMNALPFWYEDEHAIYVHAGLQRGATGFLHPAQAILRPVLAWVRTEDFIRNYEGKRVLFGHTPVTLLPPELSTYTPDAPADLWESEHAIGLDTGCGTGGFLTAIELPRMQVYESR